MASWLKKQASEEKAHACEMASYIIKRGGKAKLDKLDVVPNDFGTPLEVFEQVAQHERRVYNMLDELVDVASAEKDKATQDFLWGFVREQVEEEATADGIVAVSYTHLCAADIRHLEVVGLPAVIFGKALYEGRITFKELENFVS